MRRFGLGLCEPSVKGPCRALFLLGTLVARPGAGGVRERDARAAIHGFLRGAEDRALDGRGGDHLGPRRLAVLALGRLLVVDQAPHLLEQLLAEEAGQQAGDDAEGREEELHAAKVYPGRGAGTSRCTMAAPDDPTDLPRRSWVKIVKRTVREFQDDNLTDWAASLTYYGVMSLFPMLIAL